MQRRDFVKTVCMTGLASGVTGSVLVAQDRLAQEGYAPLIELRKYYTTSLAKRDALIEHVTRAMLPALKRLQCAPVGLFTAPAAMQVDSKTDWEHDLFVLFTNSTTHQVKCIDNTLLNDERFMRDAAAFYKIPLAESLYQQCEAVLMAGFPSCPSIDVPVSSPDRVFQMRYYQSYNIERNAAKIAMFEDGELALFRECGLHPIFFGATLYGSLMPNLTYMVGFENEDAKKKSWDTFIKHSLWSKMKSDLKYKETATTIVNINLRPCEGSQI